MAATQDEGYREIQLSGKQIVFWFMAFVVIGVVVFLLGVQVGRGVLAERGQPSSNTAASATEAEPPAPPAAQASGAPVTAGEKLSYAERLAAPEPTSEPLKRPEEIAPPAPRADAPVPPAATSAPPASTKPREPAPKPSAVASGSTEPPGPGYSIQVAALREREEADTIVKRLAAKGYPAYVAAPIKEKVPIFRVRIGKYKDRREADTVAAKLQKEEQFKPWVVR
jgi:cell division septation protein DedD